jgi:hypothetical protein
MLSFQIQALQLFFRETSLSIGDQVIFIKVEILPQFLLVHPLPLLWIDTDILQGVHELPKARLSASRS